MLRCRRAQSPRAAATPFRRGSFLLALVLVVFYWPILANIVAVYTAPSSFYAHGFLVPVACVYLLWEKKDRLKSIPRGSCRGGILLIVLGCGMHLFGLRAGVNFASGISIPLVILGLSLYHGGKAYTREILPVLGLLVFMIPLPPWILYQMTFSLKMAAAALGSSLVRFLGIPVLRDGIYIDLPDGVSFAIEDPCSGLRSIVSLSALGYILAALAAVSMRKKLLIFLAAAPMAWGSNIMRVGATILLVYHAGVPLSPLPHILVGLDAFLIALILLLVWSNYLSCSENREASR